MLQRKPGLEGKPLALRILKTSIRVSLGREFGDHGYFHVVNAFDRCSQFVLSFFLWEVAVGVSRSNERDQSAPTQTAP